VKTHAFLFLQKIDIDVNEVRILYKTAIKESKEIAKGRWLGNNLNKSKEIGG